MPAASRIAPVFVALAALIALAAGLAPRPVPAAPMMPVAATANTYEVDFVHSSLVFRLRHFGVSWFTGRINEPRGEFIIDHDSPSNNRVHIVAEIDNMDTGSDGRDDFLVGADMFNSREFPTAEFKSTSVKKIDDTTYEAAGEFTMRGVTRPLTAKLTQFTEKKLDRFGQRAGFVCEITFKRSDHGMAMFVSDGTLGDETTITAYIEGVVRPDED